MKQRPHKSKSRRTAERAASRNSAGPRSVEPPPSPARRWLFRLVALVFIPLVLLAVIEVGLRLGGYGYDPGLFRKITIGDGEYFVNNEAFGLRFFPPQLARSLGPIRMPANKAAGTYRIFILGESAAMGDPEPAYGAGRYLEALLSARYPQTHFEIINLGITAINSHVILPIARNCARREGDLWIIYMGNNEMVGPFGAATVFGEKTPPLPLIRFNLALQKTRLGQLLVNLGRKLKAGTPAAPSWSGMEMFVGNQLPADDPRRELVYHHFSRNLRDIVKTGLNSGAKILLSTVAVNLKDCAPFASMVNSNLPSSDRAQFNQLFAEGVRAENLGDFAQATQQFESAAKFDAKVAELQFRWGQSLLSLTNFTVAREHLQLACDDDALPFRADSRINALIAAVGRQLANDKLVLFDAAGALATNTPAELCGVETFFEHVHFNFDGSYRLGRAWAEQVAAMLPGKISDAAATNRWASQSACDRRLGLSDWNRELTLNHMLGRLGQPPLRDQLNNATRVENLKTRVKELQSGMDAAGTAQADADFQAALQRAPDDYYLHGNYAEFLQSSAGNLPQATVQWRRVHDLLPQDCIACFELGRMMELQEQWADAETWYRRAVELRPILSEGWIELGKVLASQGKYADALASFTIAQGQRPGDSQIYLHSGLVLAKLNRHAEAVEKYRAAIRLNSADWEAHHELGGELDLASQVDAASDEFGAAARLNPNSARTHLNYGVLLAKQKRLDAARHEFEESLRLDPTYTRAQEYLAKIQMLKRGTP